MDDRGLMPGEMLRYRKRGVPERLHHTFRDFWDVQKLPPDMPAIQLEAGINAPAPTATGNGDRLAAVLLRSSPEKAGNPTTPWHDEFLLTEGTVRYYGDHRPGGVRLFGETAGDKRLEAVWSHHRAVDRAGRLDAPPLLVFRTEPVEISGQVRPKGFVRFVGLGVLRGLSRVQQADSAGVTFDNYLADISLLTLDESGLNWDWINARRSEVRAAEDLLLAAPESWRAWVELGAVVLPRVTLAASANGRRATVTSQPALPVPSKVLPWIAARATEQFLGRASTRITRIDAGVSTSTFRGQHRLGSGTAAVDLAVAGWAVPTEAHANGISHSVSRVPTQVIRVVVCPEKVSPSVFADSSGPLVLLTGNDFARQVLALAQAATGGDIDALLRRLEGALLAEPK